MKKFFMLLLVSSTLTACGINTNYNKTIVSTKNYDFTNKNLVLGKQVIARSDNDIGIWAEQKAIEEAISRNNCTVALVNVKITDHGRNIEGTEVIDPTIGNCAK